MGQRQIWGFSVYGGILQLAWCPSSDFMQAEIRGLACNMHLIIDGGGDIYAFNPSGTNRDFYVRWLSHGARTRLLWRRRYRTRPIHHPSLHDLWRWIWLSPRVVSRALSDPACRVRSL